MLGRIKALCTGVVAWEDQNGGTETERLSWPLRWRLFGVHSYNWRWVKRFGRQSCGCTVNPLTRRRVLVNFDCAMESLGIDPEELEVELHEDY